MNREEGHFKWEGLAQANGGNNECSMLESLVIMLASVRDTSWRNDNIRLDVEDELKFWWHHRIS